MSGAGSLPNNAVSGAETNSYFNHDGVNHFPASGFVKPGLMHETGSQQPDSQSQLNAVAMSNQPSKPPAATSYQSMDSNAQWHGAQQTGYNAAGMMAQGAPQTGYNAPRMTANAPGRPQGPPQTNPVQQMPSHGQQFQGVGPAQPRNAPPSSQVSNGPTSRATPPPASRNIPATSAAQQMTGPTTTMTQQQPYDRASPLLSTRQPVHPYQKPQQPVASPKTDSIHGQQEMQSMYPVQRPQQLVARPATGSVQGQQQQIQSVYPDQRRQQPVADPTAGYIQGQQQRSPASAPRPGVPPSSMTQPPQSRTLPVNAAQQQTNYAAASSPSQGFAHAGSAFSPVPTTPPHAAAPNQSVTPPSSGLSILHSGAAAMSPPQSLPGLQPPSSQSASHRSTPSPQSMSALHSGKPKRPTMQASGGYSGQPGVPPVGSTPPRSGASTPSGVPASSGDGVPAPTSYPSSPAQDSGASRPSYMSKRRQYPTQQTPSMQVPGGRANMANPAGQGFPAPMPGQVTGGQVTPPMPGQVTGGQMPHPMPGQVTGGQMPRPMPGQVTGGQMPRPMPGQVTGPSGAQPQHMGMRQAGQPMPGYRGSPLDAPMGRLTVQQPTGVQPVSLMDQRHIVPTTPIEPPVPPLHPDLQNKNCHPSVLCCTLNAIPETKSLLTKSRLPLGIHVYPFRDLQSLPVIHSSVITRCRSCRTYINPFVTFTDARRWRCPMCFRSNEVPEEFCYDPASKSYGDPSRRPEVKSATVEFIAPSEYMLRPPQPAVFLFVFDVSFNAIETGYLHIACKLLKENLDKLPGDSRTLIGFISFNSTVHFYSLKSKLSQPQTYIVSDLDDVFLPAPDDLLVNLKESKELIHQLLDALPTMFSASRNIHSATGAALQAALKLCGPTGARVSLFQTTLPNLGPGELKRREEPNQKSSPKDVVNLAPATDFYKKFALDCAAEQVAIDLFLLSGQYADIATLMCASKYSGGCIYYYPDFHAARNPTAVEKFENEFNRYLTRKIGFEAVMRVRCTRGLSIHTFHGNFFVRSTDLVSLPNVNPDTSFCMQIDIEDSLTDSNVVCIQSALLYTSAKGERRIRVHTLAMPTTTKLQDVYAHANQQAIASLLGKMAVDRTLSSSLGDAREATMNACLDFLTVYRESVANQPQSSQIIAPYSLRLLPLYSLALLKHVSFRLGSTSRLDERCYAMQQLKTMPLSLTMLTLYPSMYPLHDISDEGVLHTKAGAIPQPPCYHLSAEKLSRQGVFLMDTGHAFYIWVGKDTPSEIVQQLFNVPNYSSIAENMGCLPELDNPLSTKVRTFLDYLQSQRTCHAVLHVFREDSRNRALFLNYLIDDRSESVMSYYEFLMHLQRQICK